MQKFLCTDRQDLVKNCGTENVFPSQDTDVLYDEIVVPRPSNLHRKRWGDETVNILRRVQMPSTAKSFLKERPCAH